jgi:hypothetical protein
MIDMIDLFELDNCEVISKRHIQAAAVGLMPSTFRNTFSAKNLLRSASVGGFASRTSQLHRIRYMSAPGQRGAGYRTREQMSLLRAISIHAPGYTAQHSIAAQDLCREAYPFPKSSPARNHARSSASSSRPLPYYSSAQQSHQATVGVVPAEQSDGRFPPVRS